MEPGGDGKIPHLRGHVLPVRYPDVGRSVVAGPLRESVSLWAGLEQAGFLSLAQASLLGGRRIRGQLHYAFGFDPRHKTSGGHDHRSDPRFRRTGSIVCPDRQMGCGGGVAGGTWNVGNSVEER